MSRKVLIACTHRRDRRTDGRTLGDGLGEHGLARAGGAVEEEALGGGEELPFLVEKVGALEREARQLEDLWIAWGWGE